MPLDPDLAAILLGWIRQTERDAREQFERIERTVIEVAESNLLFPGPVTGRHYHASPMVLCRGLPGVRGGPGCLVLDRLSRSQREAAGKFGHIGWHTFRHTYRSWLDDTGAPFSIQQKLMRHAQVSTTMNVYGNALMESKSEANSEVVKKMALRSA